MTIEIPEYKSEVRVNSSEMRWMSDKDFLILKVYKPYRYGWDDNVRKFRTFINFPSRIDDEVVYSWDTRAKIVEWDVMMPREQIWDNEAKKFCFKKIVANRDFYKAFKKVFDVDVAPSSDVKFKIYDSKLKQDVDVTMGLGNTFTIKAVSAPRVIGMLEAFDLDANVPLVDGKDKLGNPAKVRPFDFEEPLVDGLRWQFIKWKVRGEGIDTRYTFKEGKSFDPMKEEIKIEDIPF